MKVLIALNPVHLLETEHPSEQHQLSSEPDLLCNCCLIKK